MRGVPIAHEPSPDRGGLMLLRRVSLALVAVAVLASACGGVWPASAVAGGADLFSPSATLTPGKSFLTGPRGASNGPFDTFGSSVAVSANGHVLAVGAPSVAGVYVFVRPRNGVWRDATATVALAGYSVSDQNGTSVAISADGSTIVSGAPDYATGGVGGVYVYQEPPGGWTNRLYAPPRPVPPTNSFYAADSTGLDAFGASVAISADGGTIVVGAPGWQNDEGAIYLFTRQHDDWRKTPNFPKLGVWANVGEPGDNFMNQGGQFGSTLAMSADADTIVVGAPGELGYEGGIYVFKRSHGRYGGYRELHDLATGTSDQAFPCNSNEPSPEGNGVGNPILGNSVAVSSDGRTIAAGQPCAGVRGQAVVYTEPSGGWLTASSNITAGLTPLPPDAVSTQLFGFSVALSGDGKTVIASDPAFANGDGGYVGWFLEPQRGWSHVNPPVAANFGSVSSQTALASAQRFGDPLAVGSIGGTIFVGGVGSRDKGAVDVFNETAAGLTPTKLVCTPSKVAVGAKSTCTVTVSDPRVGGPVPRGTVNFSANGGATGHINHHSCTLRVDHRKQSAALCSVTFTPSSPVGHTIAAVYAGDVHHPVGVSIAVVRTSRHATHTSVSCTPAKLKVGAKTLCTADVAGHSLAFTIGFTAPGGTLTGRHCALGSSAEICTVYFSAAKAGRDIVSAGYPNGDKRYAPSYGYTTVTVTA